MSNKSTDLARLKQAIDGFGSYRKRWQCLDGAGRFLLWGPGALLLWFLADWAILLPPWVLLISFVLTLGVCLWALPWFGLRPWLRPVKQQEEAIKIETLHGDLDNLVIGALQLGEELEESETSGHGLNHSSLLVTALLKRATEQVKSLDLNKLVDLGPAKRFLAAGVAVAIIIVGCGIFAGAAIQDRVHRLQDAYAYALDSLFPITLVVTPGDRAVVRHTALTLEVEVQGAHRSEVSLWRQAGEDEPGEWTVLALEDGRARFEIADVAADFTYRFRYGSQESPLYTITAGDLPEISAISYELAFPAYTGQAPRTINGRLPTVQGLAGTTVLVSFAATTDLHPDGCYVEWQNGPKQPVSVTGRFGHFSFAMDRPDRATVHLTGALGPEFAMAQPLSFEVRVTADRPPNVSLRMKAKTLTLLAEQAAGFAFEYEAEDDYGVAETTLTYKIDCIDELLGRPVRDGQRQIRLDPPQDRVRGTYAEMFSSLDPPLAPGDRITFSVSAKDNNTETGPGLGRSQSVEIIVVAPDLAAFTEKGFGFGGRSPLVGLSRVKRQTNLLIEPDKAIRTEEKRVLEKQDLKAQVNQEAWPSGSEDSVGQYFQILSEGK